MTLKSFAFIYLSSLFLSYISLSHASPFFFLSLLSRPQFFFLKYWIQCSWCSKQPLIWNTWFGRLAIYVCNAWMVMFWSWMMYLIGRKKFELGWKRFEFGFLKLNWSQTWFLKKRENSWVGYIWHPNISLSGSCSINSYMHGRKLAIKLSKTNQTILN